MVELELISIPKSITANIEFAGNILFWVVVAVFGIWLFSKFFGNLGILREETRVPEISVKPAA
jgi:hypothetical protein